MTILIIPTEECQFCCTYCFEPEEVRQPKEKMELDIPAITRSLNKLYASPEKKGANVGVHGGECLLAGRRELESIFDLIQRVTAEENQDPNTVYTSITTNGYEINDAWIRTFKKYNTGVGISLDGPEELNTLRGPNPKNAKVTLGYNRRMKKIIRKLRKNDIRVSMMCILHTENAGNQEKLDILKEWLLELSDLDIVHGRVNMMYGTYWNKQYELSNEQLTHAWKEIFDLNCEHDLMWNPLREMQDNLLGFPLGPCSLGQCDFFRTPTVSILPDGTISGCDRTFCDGLYVRPEEYIVSGRYKALEQLDCKGCKYWSICGGVCPCEAPDNDWRHKSRFCESIYALYEHIEGKMKGMFPNARFVTDEDHNDNALVRMSYHFAEKPSVWRRNVAFHPVQPQLPPLRPASGHGDVPHRNIPHADSRRQRR